MFKKISNKIIASYTLSFFVITILTGIVVNLYFSSIIKKNIYSYFRSSNRARAEHIRTFLQDQEKTAKNLSASSIFRNLLETEVDSDQYPALKNQVNQRLLRTISSDQSIYEVFIIDSQGKIVASSNKNNEGLDKSNDTFFTAAKDNVFIKDIYFSDVIRKFNYTISAPIKDDNGKLMGVAVLRYLPENFFSIVGGENGLGKTEENFLINKDKLVLTPSVFLTEDDVMTKKIESQNATDCFDPAEIDYVKANGYKDILKNLGSQIVEAKDYRNVNIIGTHSYIPETDWCLITKADRSELYDFQSLLGVMFFGVIFFGVLLFLFVGYLLSKRITKPIIGLMEGIQNVKKGDLNYQIQTNTHDEISKISEDFNEMTKMVKQSRSEVEKKVKEQTAELLKVKNDLESKFNESDRFNKLVVGREVKMIELKKRIAELENLLAKNK